MGKKNFDFDLLSGGKSVSEKVKEIKMHDDTKNAIIKTGKKPSKENIINAVEIIKNDKIINEKERAIIIEEFQLKFIRDFNFDNCPENYIDLKKEAKFLAGISQYSFLLMAQRLKKIRDEKLYEIDGYNHFKQFIENEMPIAKRTSYDYINIIEYFGVRLVALGDVQYSKLLPIVPLLRSDNENIPKDKLKEKYLKDINIKTKREIILEANELKVKYGIMIKKQKNIKLEKLFNTFIEKIPNDLSEYDKITLNNFIEKLKELIK